MKKEEFKEMFLSTISHGWGEYDRHLKEVANDRKRLAKLHNTVRLVALPVEPACMSKAVGEARRPLMLCGARLYIKKNARKYANDFRV